MDLAAQWSFECSGEDKGPVRAGSRKGARTGRGAGTFKELCFLGEAELGSAGDWDFVREHCGGVGGASAEVTLGVRGSQESGQDLLEGQSGRLYLV